ncbi:MAG: carbohydrate-binding family 9-like protein [Verrucomicrobiota bacterium JB023]|nr:carbohydrate-binding family 9-like protein [Verrucomicrobiota bacterium JB023]
MATDHWDPSLRRHYQCKRVGGEDDWQFLPWSEEFVDITGQDELKPRYRTRFKMGWDEEFLHVRVEMEEPHVWGTIKKKNEVIFHDNDIEVFIDPDGDGLNYYEFEMNALGTIWELSLTKPYKDGGDAIHGCNMKGLRRKVIVHGTLNQPTSEDNGWEAHISFPWNELKQYHREGTSPPAKGDRWRINLSRVQWKHTIEDGQYVRVPPHGTTLKQGNDEYHPEDNWVWSPQGLINMHYPERWGEVVFV